MRASDLGVALLGLALLPAPVTRAEVFLSPGIDARVGYASNRFLDADSDGSAFTRVTPSLEVSAFLPGDDEIDAQISLRRTDYLRDELGSVQEVQGGVTATVPHGAFTGSLGLSAGTYRDEALEDDDSLWIAFTPGASWLVDPKCSVSLTGSVTATRYRSRETIDSQEIVDSQESTDGERQRDLFWEIRPGVLWTPFAGTQFWAELYGEVNRSNEPTEEFEGAGIAAGVDLLIRASARAGAWARYGARNYEEALSEEEEDRRDVPFSAGGWAAFRLAPWAEITAGLSHVNYRSTEDAQAYASWTVEAGLRVVYDWQVTPR